MEKESFEELAEKAFDALPSAIKERIDNVQIVIEDYPTEEQWKRVGLRSKYQLLGLYEGIPLQKRGPWYGMSATVPDRISLFQKNIESICRSDAEIERKIRDVLIHEIAHYFGMSEEEVRAAGY